MQPGQYQILDPVVGGEPGPSVSELAGRLVALVPYSIDENAPAYNPAPGQPATKPELTADIFVLDGGPLTFGAAPRAVPPRPQPTHRIETPAEFTQRKFQHKNIVDSCRAAIGRGVVIGVIAQGVANDPRNNAPWNLTKLADDDPRRQIVAQYLGAKSAGMAPVNKPIALLPPGMPQPGQYAPQAQQANGYAPAQPQQWTPAPQAPPAQPQYTPAAPPWPQPQQAAALQQPWMPPPPQSAPPVQQQAPQPPPGYEALWPSFTPEQQQAVLANAAAQQQQQAPQGVPNPY